MTERSTDKRVIRTKKAIRAALFKLMESKDIATITISELTALANVNRRTFYTHYSNLTDILDETESEIVDALQGLIDQFNTDDLMESTYTFFIGLNRLITEDYGFYFRLMNSDFRGVLLTRMRSMMKSSEDKIIGRFSVPADDKLGMPLASFVNGGFLNLFLEWNKSDKSVPIETAARVASVMVAHCVKNLPEITRQLSNAVSQDNSN
ncbi:MAG: TetR/AcrR family transcriptional regulator [Oscillospiraceae bacterium]